LLRPLRSTLFPYTTLFRSRETCYSRNPLSVFPFPLPASRLCVRARIIDATTDTASTPPTVASAAPIGICTQRDAIILPPVSTRRSEEHTSELQSRSDLVCR